MSGRARLDELAVLETRHPHVREPILAAGNVRQADPNITDDDAQAMAAMRGVRITAASIHGRLLRPLLESEQQHAT